MNDSSRLRTALAAASSLGAGVAFRVMVPADVWATWLPLVALVVAAPFAFVRSLGAQLLARALWWSNLFLGVVLCVLGARHERPSGLALTLLCAAALLLADRRTLQGAAQARGARPAAHAGSIQLLMILALADAQTLLLIGVLHLEGSKDRVFPGALLLAAAGALVVGFVGLYRLALWGVAVTMITALTLLVVLTSKAIRIDGDVVPPLIVLAILQILAPLPMLRSVFTGKPLPAPSPRARSLAASAVIVVVALVGSVAVLVR